MADQPTWIALAIGLSVPVGGIIGGLLTSWNKNRETKLAEAEGRETAEQRRQRMVFEAQDDLNRDIRADLAAIRQELADERSISAQLRRRIADVERDRDQGWVRGRAMEAQCHEINHIWRNRFMAVNLTLLQAGMAELQLPTVVIKSMQEILS